MPARWTHGAGVAYPAAGAVWQPLNLINGWSNGEDNCLNGNPSYYVKDGVAYLNGLLRQLPGGSCACTVLPPRPRNPMQSRPPALEEA